MRPGEGENQSPCNKKANARILLAGLMASLLLGIGWGICFSKKHSRDNMKSGSKGLLPPTYDNVPHDKP